MIHLPFTFGIHKLPVDCHDDVIWLQPSQAQTEVEMTLKICSLSYISLQDIKETHVCSLVGARGCEPERFCTISRLIVLFTEKVYREVNDGAYNNSQQLPHGKTRCCNYGRPNDVKAKQDIKKDIQSHLQLSHCITGELQISGKNMSRSVSPVLKKLRSIYPALLAGSVIIGYSPYCNQVAIKNSHVHSQSRLCSCYNKKKYMWSNIVSFRQRWSRISYFQLLGLGQCKH